MLSDFLAKNETLALPAESKTPEVEKIPALPITGNEIPMFINFEKIHNIFFQILSDKPVFFFFSEEPVGSLF